MQKTRWSAPDEAVREAWLQSLMEENPAFERIEAGKSVLGRSIPALLIGNRSEVVLYCGGIHALEWMTSLLLLRFAADLSKAHRTAARLEGVALHLALQTRGLLLVPCLNPDGVELVLHGMEAAGALRPEVERISGGDLSGWQANLRGVDLNHNYDAGADRLREMERAAGIMGPAPRQYAGEYPGSEPETQAILALCRRFKVARLYAFHAQGEEIFWRYGPNTPPQSHLMGELLAASSGYTLLDPEGMAGHGGMKDWFIERYRRPGFTIEIGKGRNPLPLEDLDGIYGRLREMLVLGMLI